MEGRRTPDADRTGDDRRPGGGSFLHRGIRIVPTFRDERSREIGRLMDEAIARDPSLVA